MKPRRLAAMLLVVLLLATSAAVYMTRQETAVTPAPNGKNGSQSPVDLQPLHTAQELARLPGSIDEQPLAKEALRLADHDTDLAFAAAMRDAAAHPQAPNAKTREILQRVQRAQKQVDTGQLKITQLTAEVAKSSDADKKDELEGELQIAKAELELEKDEVTDAKEDLMRAGGDPQGRIQRMVEQHEAAEHDAEGNAPAPEPNALPLPSRGLAGTIQEWNRSRQKLDRLLAAQRDAAAVLAVSTKRHAVLAKQLGSERLAADIAVADFGEGDRSERLTSAQQLSAAQKQMVDLDKRMDDQKNLAATYGRWADLVAMQKLAALHDILLGVLWILVALLIVLYVGGWLERLSMRLTTDRRRLATLRSVVRVAAEAAGVVVILLLLFGPPAQLATVLGLAGAGLTVALKDFIVGFFGWFVLMGKNGMRVGDWVEIKGVGGEVVEIGLFHTVLLETGNWTDMGHPTGRSVTFVNSFAIEGHYFNFSTSGQWLWDEMKLSIPVGQEPTEFVDAIQKRISAETAADARLAEQEWQRVASTHGMGAFSAEPSVSVRPGGGGIEILIRYITRANERHQVRSKIYRALVELMRHKNLPPPEPAAS